MNTRPPDVGAALALIAGSVLVIVSAVSMSHNHPAPTAFGTPVRTQHEPTQGVAAATDPAGTNAYPVGPPTTSLPLPSATTNPTRPVQLAMPSVQVTAQVDAVDVTDGILDVPGDISHVGWWRQSMPAGASSGTTVLDGHVDSARDGLGALFDLSRLQPGDSVILTTEAATRITYRVYARSMYVKAGGLPAELFAHTGPPRLVLISCGGPFNHTTHSYKDNVAVFAAPE